VLAALVAAPLAGCRMMQRHQERKIPQYGEVDASLPRELQMVSHPRHVLEPPDALEIATRPALPDLAMRSVQVAADGTVDLGLFGHFYVAGLTPEQAELKLAALLSAVPELKEAKEPLEVSIRVTDSQSSKRYYVLGTVANPNSYPITGKETVLDAILRAGLKSNSLPEKSYLVRPHPTGGPDQVFSIDWAGITQRGDTLTNYQVLPGDRIYVPGGRPPGLVQTLFGG
jgi:polysaccharide export outer membrane protein